MHSHNVLTIAVEMFKGSKALVKGIFATIFKTTNKINCNLYTFSNFSIPSVNSVFNGPETVFVPSEIKVHGSLEAFKYTIKNVNQGITK